MSQASDKKPGISGQDFDQCVLRKERESGEEDSKLIKMQQRYWEAKQAFISKLRRKEDDCIVASDAPLDAKLELFRSIEETCCNLLYILEGYQDRLCALAHEENATGRFLKECGKIDRTRAGKMMTASGKTLCYTAQQRIQLRHPLVRLYQEVETFQYRAITDTMMTIERMEKARIAYRGALLWMKDLSSQLDPDTYKQLEKFRKVQGQVRRAKARFDKLKIDSQQKIDMLCASRCNMFSHALVLYQNSLSSFWERSSKAMKAISENFKGYQHYEFNLLKDLTETSKKLAQEDNSVQFEDLLKENVDDKDALIFFESEYHDEERKLLPKRKNSKTSKSVPSSSSKDQKLVDLGDLQSDETQRRQKFHDIIDSHLDPEDLNVLNDIFSNNGPSENIPALPSDESNSKGFFPSHFLNFQSNSALLDSSLGSGSQKSGQKTQSNDKIKSASGQQDNKKNDWFNLFAELDPLSNPDALGSKGDSDRYC